MFYLRTCAEETRNPVSFAGLRIGLVALAPVMPFTCLRPCLKFCQQWAHSKKFLHNDPVKIPTLLKAGMAHEQFESIHPFLDGNGRLGRLLITFILCAEGALSQPLLYLSLYLKQNRAAYYEKLQRIRTHGEWESWLLLSAGC